MKKISPIIAIIVLASLITGCATSYKPIILENMTYQRVQSDEKYTIEVANDLLLVSNNPRYQKYAQASNLKLYSVKVTNNTDKPITITYDNFVATSGQGRLPLAQLEGSVTSLKQPGAIYLLWGLLWISFCSGGGDGEDPSCVPIPIGLVIGLMNWGTASSSNSRIQSDLISQALIGQTIQPGQQVAGVVGLHSSSGVSVQFSIVQ